MRRFYTNKRTVAAMSKEKGGGSSKVGHMMVSGRILDLATSNYSADDYERSGDPATLYLPEGFKAGAAASNAYYEERYDLGLVIAESFFGGAGLFPQTYNQAAPVIWSEGRTSQGRAILINSGQCNSQTGKEGLENCRLIAERLEELLRIPAEEILLASTGVARSPLNMKAILSVLPDLKSELREDGFYDFASSILTSDNFFNIVIFRTLIPPGKPYRIFACVEKSRGADLIEDNPLLAVILTDLPVSSQVLQKSLLYAAENTLKNNMCRDKSRANDSIFILSSGTNGDPPVTDYDSEEGDCFKKILKEVMQKLVDFLHMEYPS
jgi:glutamate N-acetyltransferase/amino-acid N-acetyltransferase